MTSEAGAGSSVAGSVPDISGELQDGIALTEVSLESQQLAAAAKQDSPPENGMGDVNPRAAELDYQHAQTAAAAATGAGFEFTPEQINTQLAHCTGQSSRRTCSVRSPAEQELFIQPAPDAASVAQANAVRNMLTETIAAIRADIAYLTDWQNKLTDAQTRYMETEHLTADQWYRLANGTCSRDHGRDVARQLSRFGVRQRSSGRSAHLASVVRQPRHVEQYCARTTSAQPTAKLPAVVSSARRFEDDHQPCTASDFDRYRPG